MGMLLSTSVHTVKFNHSLPDTIMKVKFNHKVVWVRQITIPIHNGFDVTKTFKSLRGLIDHYNPHHIPSVKVVVTGVIPSFATGSTTGLDVTLEITPGSEIQGRSPSATGLALQGKIKLINNGVIRGAGGTGGKGGTGHKGATGTKGANIAKKAYTVHTGKKYSWQGSNGAAMNVTNGGKHSLGSRNPGWYAGIQPFPNGKSIFEIWGPNGHTKVTVPAHGNAHFTIMGLKGAIGRKNATLYPWWFPKGSWQKSHTAYHPAKTGGKGGTGGTGGAGGAGGTGAYYGHALVKGHGGSKGHGGGGGHGSSPAGGHSGATGHTGYSGGTGGNGGYWGVAGSTGNTGYGHGSGGAHGGAAGRAITGKGYMVTGSMAGRVSGTVV